MLSPRVCLYSVFILWQVFIDFIGVYSLDIDNLLKLIFSFGPTSPLPFGSDFSSWDLFLLLSFRSETTWPCSFVPAAIILLMHLLLSVLSSSALVYAFFFSHPKDISCHFTFFCQLPSTFHLWFLEWVVYFCCLHFLSSLHNVLISCNPAPAFWNYFDLDWEHHLQLLPAEYKLPASMSSCLSFCFLYLPWYFVLTLFPFLAFALLLYCFPTSGNLSLSSVFHSSLSFP